MVNVPSSRFDRQVQQPQRERHVLNRLDLEADPFGLREDVMRSYSAFGEQRVSRRQGPEGIAGDGKGRGTLSLWQGQSAEIHTASLFD